ncbi:MAG: caspase family protein [Magnetococcales bacterium]|nr:caspase family protein [Magnetococcales bacterium]
MPRLLSFLAIAAVTAALFGGPSQAWAAKRDPCPVARELAQKGMDLFDGQQREKGVAALKEAYGLCPDDLDVGYNLGLALFQTDRHEEARFTWETVLQKHPEDLRSNANLAWSYFMLGRDEAAHLKAFQQLRKHPGQLSLAHTEVYALFRMGRYLEAYDWLDRAQLEGVRAQRWREQAVTFVVEDLWRSFREGRRLEPIQEVVNKLIEEYPQEKAFVAAKDKLVLAAVDPEAEVPFRLDLPHDSWPKSGDVDDNREVLDDFIHAVPPMVNWSRRTDAFGLFAGVKQYLRTGGHPFGDRDASNLHRLLTTWGYLPAADEHARLRVDREATALNLRQDLEWLLTQGRLNPNAMLIFYFSGHAISREGAAAGEREVWLLPFEAHADQVATQGVSLNAFRNALATLPNREVMVLLDVCFDGSPRCAGSKTVSSAPPPSYFDIGKPWAVASLSGPASSYGPGRQGAFSYFLTKGLLGQADGKVDGQTDGWVDLEEALFYAKEAMASRSLGPEPQRRSPARLRVTRVGGEQ